MKEHFDLLAITRKNILDEINACSNEQLFEIPAGFNNHVLWNAVHLIVTQQVLIYGNTDTPFRIDQAIIDRYRKGTTPTGEVDQEMVDFAKEQLLTSVETLKADYGKGIFGAYKPVTTSYGAPLNSVEDAIRFNNVHEGMHYGQIKMLKRIISQ